MRFGLQIYQDPEAENLWDDVLAKARAAEESGFDSVWLWDHLMFDRTWGESDWGPTLECFTGLAALAAATERVKIGHLVAGVPFRNPTLVAKMATSLDVISHGRAILGLGAAWMEREFEGYGYPFEDVPTRMKRLEEAIRVILTMWRERPATFEGRFYRADRALNDPPPLQKPHPPLLIGGNGEKVTLRLVAQYGQMCNVDGEPEVVGQRFEVLREHCRRLGRDPAEITFSSYGWAIVGRDEAEAAAKLERLGERRRRYAGQAGSPEQLIEWFRAYAAAGSQYAIFQMTGQPAEDARLFGETVIPALREA
ncbi:MAG TPA: TIGR03560 family F420-dependent LLM class oxidoreductase [Chloroflexota bacterium]|jgi:F420-dependent oxidoreductase-like protein